MGTDLTQQIEAERAELAAAPLVQLGPAVQRCHFCGQLAATGSVVEVVDGHEVRGQERFKGGCCGG